MRAGAKARVGKPGAGQFGDSLFVPWGVLALALDGCVPLDSDRSEVGQLSGFKLRAAAVGV